MSAKLVLNTNRTVTVNVPVPTEAGIVEFKAVCKVYNHKEMNGEERILKGLVVSVSDLEVHKPDGSPLNQEELVDFVINDDLLSGLTMQAYNLGNQNTLTKSRTYLQQSEGS